LGKVPTVSTFNPWRDGDIEILGNSPIFTKKKGDKSDDFGSLLVGKRWGTNIMS